MVNHLWKESTRFRHALVVQDGGVEDLVPRGEYEIARMGKMVRSCVSGAGDCL